MPNELEVVWYWEVVGYRRIKLDCMSRLDRWFTDVSTPLVVARFQGARNKECMTPATIIAMYLYTPTPV